MSTTERLTDSEGTPIEPGDILVSSQCPDGVGAEVVSIIEGVARLRHGLGKESRINAASLRSSFWVKRKPDTGGKERG